MLPYVVKRPISLVRCPEGIDGERFFQRHGMRGMNKAIKEIPIPGGETEKDYIYVGNAAGLFALVQISAVEIHDWGVSLKHVSEPDRVVFDLDPDEGLELATLKAAAMEVREFLSDLGLTSFLKSTGGKGLHLVAPIAPKRGWDEVKGFCKGIADALVSARPDRYTTNPLKRTREGKIFVDYLRNGRGATAIASYSPRAKPDGPVALPIEWSDLDPTMPTAPRISLLEVPSIIAARSQDPWRDFERSRRSLTD